MRRERADHTLDAIALVHEAYIKLTELHTPGFRDRSHFLSMVSCVMRRILVDYARTRNAAKRGGGVSNAALEEALLVPEVRADVMDIQEALERLEEVDERKARIIEQRYFSGFTLEDIALRQGISLSTVKYELRFARASLGRELRETAAVNTQSESASAGESADGSRAADVGTAPLDSNAALAPLPSPAPRTRSRSGCLR